MIAVVSSVQYSQQVHCHPTASSQLLPATTPVEMIQGMYELKNAAMIPAMYWPVGKTMGLEEGGPAWGVWGFCCPRPTTPWP